MGQDNIYKLLKKLPIEWYSNRDVAAKIDISQGNITSSLNKLFKRGDVMRKEQSTQGRAWKYIYKLKIQGGKEE